METLSRLFVLGLLASSCGATSATPHWALDQQGESENRSKEDANTSLNDELATIIHESLGEFQSCRDAFGTPAKSARLTLKLGPQGLISQDWGELPAGELRDCFSQVMGSAQIPNQVGSAEFYFFFDLIPHFRNLDGETLDADLIRRQPGGCFTNAGVVANDATSARLKIAADGKLESVVWTKTPLESGLNQCIERHLRKLTFASTGVTRWSEQDFEFTITHGFRNKTSPPVETLDRKSQNTSVINALQMTRMWTCDKRRVKDASGRLSIVIKPDGTVESQRWTDLPEDPEFQNCLVQMIESTQFPTLPETMEFRITLSFSYRLFVARHDIGTTKAIATHRSQIQNCVDHRLDKSSQGVHLVAHVGIGADGATQSCAFVSDPRSVSVGNCICDELKHIEFDTLYKREIEIPFDFPR